MGLSGRAILLLDNCAAHPNGCVLCSQNGQFKCVFLPPNTTSMIQQLDGGILETTKRNYRKLLLQRLLITNEGENSPSLFEAIKSVNLKDVVYMVSDSWMEIQADSIEKIWQRTLLNRADGQCQLTIESNTNTRSEFDISSESDMHEEAAIVSGEFQEAGLDINVSDAQQWLTSDRYEQGHSSMTDDEILSRVVCKPISDVEEVEDNDLVDEPDTPSNSEAFACFSRCIFG